MVVSDSAHVVGHCDGAAIAAPLCDITAAVGQSDRLGIVWDANLVRPENKQGDQLMFGILEALGKKARFGPGRVGLLGHATCEHHATRERRLNDHLLSCARIHVVETTYGLSHPLPAFGEQRHTHPGACRCRGEFDADFRITRGGKRPVQGGSEIVDLDPERLGPARRIHRGALSEQVAEVKGVTAAKNILLIAFGQSLQGKSACGVEQPQPRFLSIGCNQGFRPKLPNTIRYPCFINLVIRDNCDRRLERKSARENAKPAQYEPLPLIEQAIAPFKRGIQGLMPCRRGPTPCPCQIQVVVKQACSLAKTINVDPAGREFDRQGDTVQAPADSGRNRRISVDQLELTSHGPHALDQQLNGWIFKRTRCRYPLIVRRTRKRGELVDILTFDTQRFPAGREYMQCWHTAKQLFRESGSSIDQMFATVEDEQRRSFQQMIDQGRHNIVCLYRQSE